MTPEISSFDTAVLLLVFNRPDVTKRVFETIKKIKPKKLYIASDGPRKHVKEDEAKVMETRNYLLSNVDWDCNLKTVFRDENLGCGTNVTLSIDWFFENEEYGIILEDDCVPVHSFFSYAEELLLHYKNDERVGMISGNNHHSNFSSVSESYFFSKFYMCWGWATWRRSWQNMDFEMTWLKTDRKKDIIGNIGYGKTSYLHWKNNVKNITDDIVDTWDFQWCFAMAAQNQLCIVPKKNLVSNIGFGKEATHTIGKARQSYGIVDELSFPLKHPQYILADKEYDRMFGGAALH